MVEPLNKTLTEVAMNTLEKLAFLFTDPDVERTSAGLGPAVSVCVGFSGFFPGRLALRVSEPVLTELTANMLGVDDEAQINREQQQDALKEIVNVVCGNALPAIAGNRVEFSLDAPRIISDGEAELSASYGPPAAVVRLMLENGFCDLFLFINGPIPESRSGALQEESH